MPPVNKLEQLYLENLPAKVQQPCTTPHPNVLLACNGSYFTTRPNRSFSEHCRIYDNARALMVDALSYVLLFFVLRSYRSGMLQQAQESRLTHCDEVRRMLSYRVLQHQLFPPATFCMLLHDIDGAVWVGNLLLNLYGSCQLPGFV